VGADYQAVGQLAGMEILKFAVPAFKVSPREGAMKKEDRSSYMMLFCALLLVRNSKATLEESVRMVPLTGNAKHLAGELAPRTAQATV
jgi:hypothetical protein